MASWYQRYLGWDWWSSFYPRPTANLLIQSGGITGSAIFVADLCQLAYEHASGLTGSALDYCALPGDPLEPLFATEVPVCHREEICTEHCYACEHVLDEIETFQRIDGLHLD